MIYIFVNIEKIKNTFREFQAENGPKFKNTQAEFKKAVSYEKKCIWPWPACLGPSSLKMKVTTERTYA